MVPTGPAGQRALRRRLQQRLEQADRADRLDPAESGFSVAVVEVDPADSRHPDGRERLLAALGSRLAGATRPSDLVVRPGRDRFVLVLGGARDDHGLAAARRRIKDVLARPVLIDGRPVRSTVAVGVVVGAPGDTVHTVLSRLVDAADRESRSARRLRIVAGPDARG